MACRHPLVARKSYWRVCGGSGGNQEGEEIGAGTVLEDDEGEVLLGAPVARRDRALLVVDAVNLGSCDFAVAGSVLHGLHNME